MHRVDEDLVHRTWEASQPYLRVRVLRFIQAEDQCIYMVYINRYLKLRLMKPSKSIYVRHAAYSALITSWKQIFRFVIVVWSYWKIACINEGSVAAGTLSKNGN